MSDFDTLERLKNRKGAESGQKQSEEAFWSDFVALPFFNALVYRNCSKLANSLI